MLGKFRFYIMMWGICISLLIFGNVCGLKLLKNHRGLGSPGPVHEPLPPDEWFDQKLDHFMPTDLRMWKQRYMTNDTFFKYNGPVFLMIGGEGEASPKWMVRGQWILYALKYNALCFQLEHRFYGKSHPTHDTSVKSLKYLSSEQALADIAYFITGMNSKYSLAKDTKWIVFGGSYPGSLAAWARMKYPFIIHGAVSSSGPLLAKVDFHEYFEVVRNALSTYSASCVDQVIIANRRISGMIRQKSGRKYVTEKFKLCDKINVTSRDDVSSLFEALSDNIANVVQYNKDNRESATKNITVDTICGIMTSSLSAVDNYAKLNSLMLSVTNETCVDYKYDKMMEQLRKTNWTDEANKGARQWLYQTCTEFGFFQTSSKSTDLFGQHMPVKYFIKMCEDVFGQRYDGLLLYEAVERSNVLYGALNINVGNMVLVHGSVDPWHALGITHSNDHKQYRALYINGTAHCANMYPPSENDPPELIRVREEISTLIGSWLNADNYESQAKEL